MLLRSMQSIGLSIPHDDSRNTAGGSRHEHHAAGRSDSHHRSDSEARRQVRALSGAHRLPRADAQLQRQAAVRRTVFIRDIDQEVRQQASSARALHADAKMLG